MKLGSFYEQAHDGKHRSKTLDRILGRLGCLRPELRKAMKKYGKDLLRITALINCGLGAHTFEWSLDNVKPVIVNFRNRKIICLLPTAVVDTLSDWKTFLSPVNTQGRWSGVEEFFLWAKRVNSQSVLWGMGFFPMHYFRENK